MKSRSVSLALMSLAALLFVGCANLQLVVSRTDPAVPEMAAAQTVGIAQFTVVAEGSRWITMRVGNEEGASIIGGADYPGSDKVVQIVVSAPDAATRYYMTKDRLASLTQDVWAQYLSGSAPFDYQGVNEKWQAEKIMSSDPEGNAVTGFPRIVKIRETVDPFRDSGTSVAGIAKNYGVDILLAGTVRVYAEAVKATDKPITTAGMDTVELEPGQYAVRVEINYDWALFDGKTGRKITDSDRSKLKFFNPDRPSSFLFPLSSMSVRGKLDLEKLMASSEYQNLFEQGMNTRIVPYLYFFVPHFKGTYEEIKEETE